MNITEAYQHFIYRLDKAGTNRTQNIGFAQFVASMNRAQYMWVRQRVSTAEATNVIADSIQRLITSVTSTGAKKDGYYENQVPPNYLHRIRAFAGVNGCSSKVWGKFVEEGNINELLRGEFTRPSSAWEETLVTVAGGKWRTYFTDFDITSATLEYYRKPIEVDISGYTHDNGTASVDIDLEFDGADAHEIIDLAVRMTAGDIGDIERINTL